MPDDSQLDRIERKIDRVESHLKTLNGKVAAHAQTLYGPRDRDGLVDDVRDLAGRINRVTPGMTSVKTVWSAIAAVAAIAAVVVAFVAGVG